MNEMYYLLSFNNYLLKITPRYKTRQILGQLVQIFPHYLSYHAFLTSFRMKFSQHDRFLERICRANQRIPVVYKKFQVRQSYLTSVLERFAPFYFSHFYITISDASLQGQTLFSSIKINILTFGFSYINTIGAILSRNTFLVKVFDIYKKLRDLC